MYQLFVEEHFDAAHYLPEYNGKCERLHGHRFKVVVRLEAEFVGNDGMAYDFADIKLRLHELLSQMDHTCLNELEAFSTKAPSSENIAAWLYSELQPRFEDTPAHLANVEVWESPTTGVSYSP